jgi:uncharacterized membrane protein YeaQ/YmgE (transglycosylase-associated protein family)
MSILAWIILGLVAGFIASKIVNKAGEGIVMDILLVAQQLTSDTASKSGTTYTTWLRLGVGTVRTVS